MKTSTIVWVLVVIIIILGAGYYFFAMSPGAAAPATSDQTNANSPNNPQNGGTGAPSATPAQAFAVGTKTSLGSYLTAATNNMTLYTYSPDTPGVSNCSGQCATNWPPYTVAAGSQLSVPTGSTGTFGTITRADGTTQVTYNNEPLYFYIKDKNPGDTVGQGVGGVWYIVKP